MKKLIILLLTILAVLLAACKSEPQSAVTGSGKVFYPVYEITAPASGKILGLILEEGDRISEGQPLFAIDDAALEEEIKTAAAEAARAEALLKAMQSGENPNANPAAIAAAREALEKAAAQEAKMAALYEQGAVARRTYEQAAAAKTTAEASLAAAQDNYGTRPPATPQQIAAQQAVLKEAQQKYNALLQQQLTLEADSPCTGIVTAKLLSINGEASAGQTVLRLQGRESCCVTLTLTTNEAARLKPGQPVTAMANGSNKTYKGSIEAVDGGSATVRLDNSSLDLREGMEVTVRAAN